MSNPDVPHSTRVRNEFAAKKVALIFTIFESNALAMVDLYSYALTDFPERNIEEEPMTRYRHDWKRRIRGLIDYGCRDLDRIITQFYNRPEDANYREYVIDQKVTEPQLAFAVLTYSVDKFFEACLDIIEEPLDGPMRPLTILERPFDSAGFRPIVLPNMATIARQLLEGRCMLAIMTVLTTLLVARDRFVAGEMIEEVMNDAAATVQQLTVNLEHIDETQESVTVTIDGH